MNLEIQQVMKWYPRIYFACHSSHVRDEKQQRTVSAHLVSVLDHLDEIEPMGLLELAGHMGVTASTMSLTVDRLERMGYAARARSLNDGRRVQLTLTAAGAEVRAAHSVLDSEKVGRVLARLSPDDRAQALRGLELLAIAADKSMDQHRGKQD